jgi:MFS-type transporter involved in bile tolerance (Atg22 family)
MGLFLGYFTVFLVYYMLSSAEEGGLGLHKSLYPITLALCVLAYIISAIIAGTFSDGFHSRYGNRVPLIITGGTLTAVLFIIAYFVLTNNEELWLFAIILFICISITRGISATPYQALMPDLFIEELRGWVALAREFFMALGTGIAIFVFPPLAKESKYTEMFIILAIVFLIVTTITAVSVPKINPIPRSDNGLTNIFKIPEHLWTYGQGKFGKILVCQVFWGLGLGTIKYFWVLYVRERLHASIDDTVIFLVLISIFAFLSIIPIGLFTSRLGKVKIGVFSSLLYITFILLLMSANRMTDLYLITPLGGLSTVGLSAVMKSLPADLLPEGHEAEFLGINSAFNMFPHPITLTIAGFILGGLITQSEAAQFTLLFSLAIIEVGIATLFLLWLKYESWNMILNSVSRQFSKINGVKKIEALD